MKNQENKKYLSNNEIAYFINKGYRIKRIISNIKGKLFTVIIVIFMLWINFVGLFHTYTKHRSELKLSWDVAPLCWYRSIEICWHKDYSGLNWEKQLSSDSAALIGLLELSLKYDYSKTLEYFEAVDSVAKRISKYPKDKKSDLKNISVLYVSYYVSRFKDNGEWLRKYAYYGDKEQIYSIESSRIENELNKYKIKGMNDWIDKWKKLEVTAIRDMSIDMMKSYKTREELISNYNDMIEVRKNMLESDESILKAIISRIFD